MQWYTETIYFDIEDGLEIAKEIAKKNYIIITKNKTIKYEKGNTIGHVTITKTCRRKPKQGQLF